MSSIAIVWSIVVWYRAAAAASTLGCLRWFSWLHERKALARRPLLADRVAAPGKVVPRPGQWLPTASVVPLAAFSIGQPRWLVWRPLRMPVLMSTPLLVLMLAIASALAHELHRHAASSI